MPLTTTTAVKQLSDQNSVGTAMGASATDKIVFYTSAVTAPIVQPSGGNQAALSRGIAGACIATAATSFTAGGVAVQTTSSKGITLGIAGATGTSPTFQVIANDFIFVNKPTTDAGIGIGYARVSATGIVAVQYSNFTAATVTATGGEKYGIVAIRGLPTIAATLTPASVAAAATAEQQFTVPGLRAGDVVSVSKPTDQATLNIVGCRVVSANTLGITFSNVSATTAVTPTAESYTIYSTAGIDTAANQILVANFEGTPGGISPTTTTALSVTMTGLALTDTVTSITKPTATTGVGGIMAFVSAASVLGVVYTNPTAGTVTPTASEIYGVTIYRPAPAAPCVVYSAPITPTGVAANTTAEQTFVMTGLLTTDYVAVSKPTAQAGLGIVGTRVSAAGVLAITFQQAHRHRWPRHRRRARFRHGLVLYHVLELDRRNDHTAGRDLSDRELPASDPGQRIDLGLHDQLSRLPQHHPDQRHPRGARTGWTQPDCRFLIPGAGLVTRPRSVAPEDRFKGSGAPLSGKPDWSGK